MPQTQIACPRCKRQIAANVEQLFDVTADPAAKQRFLGGASNVARCPHCGFEGRLATPVVYHDSDKELLLTYFPAELGMAVHEQERQFGPLITQITNRLPAEKRKAYLFKPMAHLTYESLVETILGKDGITPEMIKAQQDRMNLVDRLLAATAPDVRSQIIKDNSSLIDEQFFILFSRLLQAGLGSAQEAVAKQLADVQKQLLAETEVGRRLEKSAGELETAAQELQKLGQSLTRESLLDLVIAAPNEDRLRGYVSLARSGMDYAFFQLLTEKIESAAPDRKTALEATRKRLLDLTADIDKQMEARYKQSGELIEKVLGEADIAKATEANLGAFTQDTVDLAQRLYQEASQANDYARMGKLQKLLDVLRAASAPPPEVALIEQMLDAPDDAAMAKMLSDNEKVVTDKFMETLSGLLTQVSAQADKGNAETKAIATRLENLYSLALKISMQRKLK